MSQRRGKRKEKVRKGKGHARKKDLDVESVPPIKACKSSCGMASRTPFPVCIVATGSRRHHTVHVAASSSRLFHYPLPSPSPSPRFHVLKVPESTFLGCLLFLGGLEFSTVATADSIFIALITESP